MRGAGAEMGTGGRSYAVNEWRSLFVIKNHDENCRVGVGVLRNRDLSAERGHGSLQVEHSLL